MRRGIFRSAARLALGVMLMTFLSPAFAWQRLATHDELGHAAEAATSAHVHDHEHGTPAEHEHHDPHGFVGHVLGHLPAFLSAPPIVPAAPAAPSEFIDVAVVLSHVTLDPPFRPPRLSSIA